jgi:hypothetical protein
LNKDTKGLSPDLKEGSSLKVTFTLVTQLLPIVPAAGSEAESARQQTADIANTEAVIGRTDRLH